MRAIFGDVRPPQVARLSDPPLYALPCRLLNLLDRRLPGWIAPDQRARAEQITATCEKARACAIFLGRVVRHLFHPPPPRPTCTAEQFEKLNISEWINKATFDIFVQKQWETFDLIRERREAYLGWLTTNPVFLAERDRLRTEHAVNALTQGEIPARRTRPACEHEAHERAQAEDETRTEFHAFYDRWDLCKLVTWDLPVPLAPNLGMPAVLGHLQGLDDRPTIQLPRTFRLPARFPIHRLLRDDTDAHLADWHAVEEQEHSSKMNYARWQRIYHLNFLLNVVLRGAYAGQFRRKAGALDEVMAEYFGDTSPESIRKLRQFIDQRRRGAR
jgi:hypothetical protein